MLFSSCTSLFYQPDRYLYTNPVKMGFNLENVYFKSADGTKLHGWYLHNKTNPEKPKGLIVHYHGNAQNMSTHFLNLAWVTNHGYDLLVFDYRGYGTSEGEPEPKGVYEDSLAAIKKAHELYKKNKAQIFVVYGQSLGGALAARSFHDFPYKNDVSLLVLDSTFTNYKRVAMQTLQKTWLTWPFSPLAWILISNEYGTEDLIPQIQVPTLIIHGKKDHVVSPKNGEGIFNSLTTKEKYFWQIDQGAHIDIFTRKDDKYRTKFLELLENLRN